jgi:hypothetical protein
MLRIGLISSVIPLALAGGIAHEWTSANAPQCFAPAAPAIRTIAFTDDPAQATVSVQLVDAADLADLVIAADNTAAEAEGCSLREMVRSVTINMRPVAGEPVVHLSREADADYRIYVDSAQISARQAAALIVRTRGGHVRLAATPSDDRPTGSIALGLP